nr:MAG TPA: Endolysin [Caudoviricetes sp.]
MSKELFYSLLLFLYKSCIKYKFDLYLQIKYYCMNKRYQTGYIKQKPYSLNTPSFNLADLRLEDIPETPSILNSNDWLNNIGSIAGGISGVIGTSLQNSRIGDTSDVEDRINSATNYKVGAYSNESLLDEWGNYNPLDYVTYSDIRGGNVAQRGLNTLSSIGSGAMGGASIGGPIGAIVGGVAGLGSSIAGWLTGNAKARRKVKELNNKIDAANRHVQSSFVNSARSIDEINDMNILSNYSAYGGPINMRSFSPMSPFGNRYSKGGAIRIKPSKRGTFTAAAKKHGKSVQAFASQVLANKENYSPAMVKKANFARNAAKWKHADGGNLNTVAPLVYPAPEWIYNPLEEPDNAPVYSPDNYISDAQYIADRWAAENSIKEGWDPNTNTYSPHPSAEGGKKTVGPGIKLGAYKGFTQDRPYTIEELNNQVVKISREKEKHIKKVLGTDTISPQIMRGLVDLSYQIKGDIAKKYPLLLEAVKEGNLNKIKEEAKVHYTPKGKTKPIEDTRRNKFREDNFWYYELGGPINTHGGVFDNGVTIVGNGGTHEENPLEGVQMGVDEQGIPNLVEEGEVIFNNYVFSNRMKAPKNLKKRYKFKGKTFADVAKSIQKESEERPNDPISKAGLDVNMARLAMSQEEVRNSKMKKRTSNKYAGGGVLPYMRYAPAVGAGINALTDLIGSTNKYDYSNVDLIQDVIDNLQAVSYKPVGNYLTYRPFDRNFYINKLNSQASATRRAIEGLSGGNRATKIAGIVASDYNTQGRLGDLARQAEEYNLAQRERVEAFNRGTNQLNSEMGLRAGQINKQNDELRLKSAITQAQLRDQIDSAVSAARSANLNNFLDSLGDIGREETIFNLINSNPGLRYGYAGRTGNIGYKTRSKGGYLTIKRKK